MGYWLRTIFWMVIGISIAGWRDRRDSYSCEECGAREDVQTSSFASWTYGGRHEVTFIGDENLVHKHVWFRYSFYYSNGLGGCLGRGVACSGSRYRNGLE